ncbi:MAG: hypothetical protein Fur0037_08030 [Planctomycetota bacterium]
MGSKTAECVLFALAGCGALPLAESGDDAPNPPAASPGEDLHHRAGQVLVEARGFGGVPILQKSLLWDGNGQVDNFGAGGRVLYSAGSFFAIGAGLNGILFKTLDHDTIAAEFETIGRGYLYHWSGYRVFWDLTGGWEQANHQVPEGGTQWNMTFSFGPGVEIPLAGGRNLVIGGRYHHMSNALGRMNDRNPSQNEGRFFLGYAWEF